MGRFSLGVELLAVEKRWVFEAIVEHEKDAVGLIGYALYKHKKHTLAKALRKQGQSDTQIQSQVQTFHDQFLHNDSIEEYRNKATDFLNQIFSEIETELRKEFDDKVALLEKSHQKALKKSRNDFLKSVQEYERLNKPLLSRLWGFLISGIPGIVSSFLITSLVIGASLIFVSETKRKEILTSLAAEYVGIDAPQQPGPKPASPR
ncbi:hypothetical protein [Stutzerimonas balearica]|uniref:hypothetical protein n=1 Tax=Stutzerimonas balearica TaxID=74829 RepID=UPI0028964778|nr:hypothetical protein [Stutzerimonas balearica]